MARVENRSAGALGHIQDIDAVIVRREIDQGCAWLPDAAHRQGLTQCIRTLQDAAGRLDFFHAAGQRRHQQMLVYQDGLPDTNTLQRVLPNLNPRGRGYARNGLIVRGDNEDQLRTKQRARDVQRQHVRVRADAAQP